MAQRYNIPVARTPSGNAQNQLQVCICSCLVFNKSLVKSSFIFYPFVIIWFSAEFSISGCEFPCNSWRGQRSKFASEVRKKQFERLSESYWFATRFRGLYTNVEWNLELILLTLPFARIWILRPVRSQGQNLSRQTPVCRLSRAFPIFPLLTVFPRGIAPALMANGKGAAEAAASPVRKLRLNPCCAESCHLAEAIISFLQY